jgi:hypothetical protein
VQLLIDLFSKPPASFVWATNEQGRTIGTSEGFVLDLWPDRIEAVAIFSPDREDVAARNGILMQLLLVALRPDWTSAASWLALQMRRAARTNKPFEETNVTRRVRFVWDRTHSRATLKVMQ